MPRDWKVIRPPERFPLVYHEIISNPIFPGRLEKGRETFKYFLHCMRSSPTHKLHRASMLPWHVRGSLEDGFTVTLRMDFPRWLRDNAPAGKYQQFFAELFGRELTLVEEQFLRQSWAKAR